MYTLSHIQNTCAYGNETPTIVVSKGEPEWAEAYKNWINGKNPTNSPEWKKGVFAVFGDYNENIF